MSYGNTPMSRHISAIQVIVAASNGDIKQLKRLLEGDSPNSSTRSTHSSPSTTNSPQSQYTNPQSTNINATNHENYTALMMASKLGATNCVEYLVSRPGIDVNKVNVYGNTALMLACQYDQANCVKALFAHPNLNVNYINTHDGYTALMIASSQGHARCVKLLLRHVQINLDIVTSSHLTAFMMTALYNHDLCLRTFLRESQQEIITLNQVDIDGNSALGLAAKHGNIEPLQTLLKQSLISINVPNQQGNTVLMLAAIYNQAKCLKLLLKQSTIDTTCVNIQGNNVFHVAAQHGALDCLRLLVQNTSTNTLKMSLNQINNNGLSVLGCALANGHILVVEFLLKQHLCDVLLFDPICHQNVLHWAARGGILQCLQLVIDEPQVRTHILDMIDAPDKNGKTPFMIAGEYGNIECINYIIQYSDQQQHRLSNYNASQHDSQRTSRTTTTTTTTTPPPTTNILTTTSTSSTIAITNEDQQPIHIENTSLLDDTVHLVNIHRTTTHDGYNILLLCVLRNQLKTVQYCIETLHIDINSEDIYGNTPFLLASKMGFLSILQVLKTYPGLHSLQYVNNDGQTAYSLAYSEHHANVISWLSQQDPTIAIQYQQQQQQLEQQQRQQQYEQEQRHQSNPDVGMTTVDDSPEKSTLSFSRPLPYTFEPQTLPLDPIFAQAYALAQSTIDALEQEHQHLQQQQQQQQQDSSDIAAHAAAATAAPVQSSGQPNKMQSSVTTTSGELAARFLRLVCSENAEQQSLDHISIATHYSSCVQATLWNSAPIRCLTFSLTASVPSALLKSEQYQGSSECYLCSIAALQKATQLPSFPYEDKCTLKKHLLTMDSNSASPVQLFSSHNCDLHTIQHLAPFSEITALLASLTHSNLMTFTFDEKHRKITEVSVCMVAATRPQQDGESSVPESQPVLDAILQLNVPKGATTGHWTALPLFHNHDQQQSSLHPQHDHKQKQGLDINNRLVELLKMSSSQPLLQQLTEEDLQAMLSTPPVNQQHQEQLPEQHPEQPPSYKLVSSDPTTITAPEADTTVIKESIASQNNPPNSDSQLVITPNSSQAVFTLSPSVATSDDSIPVNNLRNPDISTAQEETASPLPTEQPLREGVDFDVGTFLADVSSISRIQQSPAVANSDEDEEHVLENDAHSSEEPSYSFISLSDCDSQTNKASHDAPAPEIALVQDENKK